MIIKGHESAMVKVGTRQQRTKIGGWVGSQSTKEVKKHFADIISKVCFEVRSWNYLRE